MDPLVALLIVASLIAAGSVWLSLRPLRALRRAEGRWLSELGKLPRSTSADSLRQRARRLPEQSGLRKAIEEVLGADTPGQAVYAVTEISLMAQSEVRRVGYLPRVAGRVAMASGTLVALVVLSETMPTGQVAVREASLSFLVGLVGMVSCSVLGRSLDQLIDERRGAWTGLLDALGQVAEDAHLPTAEIPAENPAVDLEPEAD